MNSSGIILTLAYPETIVRVSDEWFVNYLRFFGIGTKDYVRAGHAAIVLIDKTSGIIDYYDFGRYIVPSPYGRVRSKTTDNELNFPLQADLEQEKIKNLNDILYFLATNPKLTHGEGKMLASVCNEIDYNKAKDYIEKLQEQYFVPYSVFRKNGSNCSRFVTYTLMESVTNPSIRKKLKKSTWFTPSTIGNVVLASNNNMVYEVSPTGEISEFASSVKRENIRYFLDGLKKFTPNLVGNLKEKPVEGINEKAQWLGGIGAGAWFELHRTEKEHEYKFKRISPYGNMDVNDIFVIDKPSFNFDEQFEFLYHSNCSFLHIKQSDTIYRFERKQKLI
ncbi:MAG TPA: DUF6695 family protein [Flavobacteriaceae bacterium]|nr:DUF6695 family protein [Flavobacteriaceae bacterium]